MNRILSAFAAAAFALSLGSGSMAATATSAPVKPPSKMSTMAKHSCPKGQTWVKGYTTKKGKKVDGYCRKG
jgi:hypothetical protein